MKTIRLKKRSLTDQIALLRMEIVLLQERVRQLEAAVKFQHDCQGYPHFDTQPPCIAPYPGYPKSYIGSPWTGQQSTTTLSNPTITGTFRISEEKA